MGSSQIALQGGAPLLISGFPRSGTAWLAGVFASCGAFGGKWVGKALDDGHGNKMEHLVLQQRVLFPCLKKRGMGEGFSPLPIVSEWHEQPAMSSTFIIEQSTTIMLRDGYEAGRGPWFYKDSRLILCAPEWSYSWPDAWWILTMRDHDLVARALVTTGGYFQSFHTALNWVKAFADIGASVLDNVPNVLCIDMDVAMSGDLSEVKRAVEKTGLRWNEKRVQQWLVNRSRRSHE